MSFDFQSMLQSRYLVYECLSGSRAYGLETSESDVDKKGVFILPPEIFYALDPPEQLQDSHNDLVYFELSKFFRLLSKSNPSILEMLRADAPGVMVSHNGIQNIELAKVLSKQCADTFGGYALSQIRKARGIRKKIALMHEKDLLHVWDFCHVFETGLKRPLLEWMDSNSWSMDACKLTRSNISDEVLILTESKNSEGMDEDFHTKSLSPFTEKNRFLAHVYFDRNAFKKYLKDVQGFLEWKKNVEQGVFGEYDKAHMYDGKSMMHAFRLLKMGIEIAETGTFMLRRSDREELMDIRYGKRKVKELVVEFESLLEKMNDCFQNSHLPQYPDLDYLESSLVQFRKQFYKSL